MKLQTVSERTDALVAALTDVWQASVRAMHTFLTEADIVALQEYVPDALRAVAHLTVLLDDSGRPAGFCGVDGQRLEMLFLHPDVTGKGAGRQLVQHAFDTYQVNEVCVNEQNPNAAAFYRHMGFVLDHRTALDEQGRPFPLLYLKRN